MTNETPAPDRLAPIEARGAVTDAMVQAGYFAEQKHEGDCGENWDRATWHVRIRKIVEAALRARESAPAVETPT